MHICFLDIDGTLVLTGGAGQTAFARTLAEDFCIAPIDGRVQFAGRSDRAIATDLFISHGVPATTENWLRFCRGYLPRLEHALATHQGFVLPGVGELISRLTARGDVALGLLTGNVREGARRKLAYYGLWHHFDFGGFGDEHLERCDIAAIALAAARKHLGSQSSTASSSPLKKAGRHAHDITNTKRFRNGPRASPLFQQLAGDGLAPAIGQVIVIGDTQHDVACGRSIGARCVAVPTGQTPVDVLRAAAPDVLVDTLEDSDPILALFDGESE